MASLLRAARAPSAGRYGLVVLAVLLFSCATDPNSVQFPQTDGCLGFWCGGDATGSLRDVADDVGNGDRDVSRADQSLSAPDAGSGDDLGDDTIEADLDLGGGGDAPVEHDGAAEHDGAPDSPAEDVGEDVCTPNRCGGCGALEGDPGDDCGPCADGIWQCNGTDDVVCVGASPGTTYFADVDLDGFGDPEEPVAFCDEPDDCWVLNALDCDDRRDTVSPEATETCNGRDDDCDEAVDEVPDDGSCADSCCDEDLVCERGRCASPCEGERCGADLDVCCGSGSSCYSGECVPTEPRCDFGTDCEVDELCEPNLGVCIQRDSVPECEYVPTRGEFAPVRSCRWTAAGLPDSGRSDVVAAPIVINLTDDNGDGLTDVRDIPDIAFLSYDVDDGFTGSHSTLRIVSGCNANQQVTHIASINTPAMTNDAGIASADLVGDDGVPEIVVIGMYGADGTMPGGTVAFRRTADDGSAWDVAWTNPDYPTWDEHTRGSAAISIADLNADGLAEVIVGNLALNGQTGALLWDGLVDGDDVGVGNNASLGPSSAVADIDLDGFMEVSAGKSLYDHNGELLWTYDFTTANSVCGGELRCDGFSAIADFDDDPEGEVVIVRRGEIYIFEHTGEVIWSQEVPRRNSDRCRYNEAGPPTVADFDGDGRNEIGTAGADFYAVADLDCDPAVGAVPAECASRGILWKVRNNDCSSRATASSVFDFDGDGAAEVVYADEENFRIFDGRTGEILFDDETHGSHTRLEMPVIADVDNDGNAEIVIPENSANGGSPGLEIWEDQSDNWVRTRRIWNQHGYSVTHIREDGTVPAEPEINWHNPRLNNWRQNVQPDGLLFAPDLQVVHVSVVPLACAMEATVTVANRGALQVPAGVSVSVTASRPGGDDVEATVETTFPLFPGQTERLVVDLVPTEPADTEVNYTLTAWVDANHHHNECDEANNTRAVDHGYSCATKP